jgi:hypothetical protein
MKHARKTLRALLVYYKLDLLLFEVLHVSRIRNLSQTS